MVKKYFLLIIFLISFSCLNAENEPVLTFPQGFLKGVGLSAFQNGGHKVGYSNWAWFQDNFITLNAKTVWGPAIKNNEKVGYSCGFWDNALNDIKLIKALGCNTFRFSIEWSEVEPVEGQFNQEILSFYSRLIDELLAQGIQPMVTLYHFVHPYWFERKGAFEKEENIEYFVRYCTKVFDFIGSKVEFWGTINEPTVSSACGYVLGIHPPGKFCRFGLAGIVLKNLLNAHVEVYKALKVMPGGSQVKIGLIHQLLQAESFDMQYASNFFIGILKKIIGMPMAELVNFSFAHKTVKNFLMTGEFDYRIPGVVRVQDFNADAPHSCDFIGLNFYSKVVFGLGPTKYPHQVMTDMEYPVWPEKIYDGIVDMADLGVPMYITENGLADAKDVNRAQFIKDYLKMVHKAIQEGYDVRGYYFWTLMDNFEWNDGYDMKFGLYKVDFETQERTLRPGALPFRDWFKVEALDHILA